MTPSGIEPATFRLVVPQPTAPPRTSCVIVLVLFKKGYQPRTNIVQDEKRDLFADFQSMFARWKNHFSRTIECKRF